MRSDEVQNDEKIPNLASKFKLNNISTIFCEKKKLSKIGQIGCFTNFRQLFGQKWQILLDLSFGA